MRYLRKLQDEWDDLAEIDAMWAICSAPNKEHNQWDQAAFFETGRQNVRNILSVANQSGVKINRGKALDFGCGVGRLTQALAEEFEECYGIDISPKMIKLAGQFNQFGERCKYVLNESDDLRVFEDNFFDFIYTVEVLQHMNPVFIEKYLEEFIRILKNRGVLIFQVPVKRIMRDEKSLYLTNLPRLHPRRVLNKVKVILLGNDPSTYYLRLKSLGFSKKWLYDHMGLRPNIEMNYLDETVIFKIIESKNAKIVSSVKSPNSSGDMLMGTYTVVKAD